MRRAAKIHTYLMFLLARIMEIMDENRYNDVILIMGYPGSSRFPLGSRKNSPGQLR